MTPQDLSKEAKKGEGKRKGEGKGKGKGEGKGKGKGEGKRDRVRSGIRGRTGIKRRKSKPKIKERKGEMEQRGKMERRKVVTEIKDKLRFQGSKRPSRAALVPLTNRGISVGSAASNHAFTNAEDRRKFLVRGILDGKVKLVGGPEQEEVFKRKRNQKRKAENSP
jgi:hypothetical protein